MLNRIRNIMPQARLEAGSLWILRVEIVLFSGIYGLLMHSWLGFGLILLGLVMLIRLPKGPFYTIYAISLMWAIIFISVGYFIAGWFGAVVLSAFVFIKGVNKHMTGLRWVKEASEPKNWEWSGHNLN